MNPAASSFANSFLMASHLSGEKCRNRCFFGVALGSTFKACSINSLGTPGISTGFHANMSRLALRKLTSSSSYLSPSLAPMMAVLESSPSCKWIVLVPTSPVGLTDDWLCFLEGIDFLEGEFLSSSKYFADRARNPDCGRMIYCFLVTFERLEEVSA